MDPVTEPETLRQPEEWNCWGIHWRQRRLNDSDYDSDDNSGVSSNLDVLVGLLKSERKKKNLKSSICYCSLGDGAAEWQHGEAITAGTRAKLQAPEQIQGKVLTYLDLIWEKWGKNIW